MAESKSVFPYKKGSKILIRSVSYFQSGEVVSANASFVRLTKAAWIADTSRFSDALKSGEFGEVEPFPKDVFVAIGAIVDMTEIPSLPTKQK